MKRNQLRELLESYFPISPDELLSKERMLAFLNQYANCFDRSLEVGHFTGSAWVVNQDNTQVLLMHHAKLNLWCQLGGHCDGEGDILRVALREAQEESGILQIEALSPKIFDLDVHPIPANQKEPEHFHYDVRFIFQVKSDEKVIQNSESKDLRWFGREGEKLPTQHRSITRMFDKWLEISRSFPLSLSSLK